MSQQRTRGEPAPKPVTPRHRRSAALSVGSWLSSTGPATRLLLGGAALLLILALIVGYVLTSSDGDGDLPPQANPTAQPAPPASEAPVPSGGPSASAPGRTTTPESDRTKPPGKPAEPRLIGPKNLQEFEQLLSAFCKKRGFRTAVLLDGPEDEPRSGNWVCVQVVEFTPINLDDACRDTLGEEAKARQLKSDDSRTWRCFDS